MKVKQRMLTLILSLMMIVTYMPAIAFAEAGDVADPEANAVTDVQSEEDAVQPESVETGEEGEESAGVSVEAEGEEDPYVEDDGGEEDGEGEVLEFSYTTSHVFYENAGGQWEEREYYDEETEKYITEKYYRYNIRYFDGDILTVDGKDYTFDSSDLVYRAEDGSTIEVFEVSIGDSQYDEPWTLAEGNDTDVTYTARYNNSSATVTAVLKPSPKYELSYTGTGSYIENVDGWTYGDENGEWFYYDLQPAEGDVLTVNGVEYTYTYTEYENEDGWTWGMRFHNSETGENLDPDYFSMFAATSQEKEHWVLGDEEEKTFPVIVSYFGNETETSVKLVQNPVESLSFTTAYEFVENRRGYMEEDDDGEEFFCYNTPFHDGDVLTVNGEDYIYDDYSYKFLFLNGSKKIDADDVNIHTDQWENHWVIPEGQNETNVTLNVSYRNHTCTAEAKLIKNPVTGITFTPVSEYVDRIEGADGYFDEGMFIYYMPEFEEGDQLTVTYWNKDPVTYVYEDDFFVNPDNKKDRIPTYDEGWDDGNSSVTVEGDQSEQWVLDGCYETTINYEGQTVPGRKIRIVQNTVESISFSRNGENRIELIPGKDSYKASDWDEETDEEYEYDFYEYYFEIGDRIIVNYVDGKTSTYEYKEIRLGGRTRERFVNIKDDSDILEDDRIYLYTADEYRQSYKNPWVVGGNYKATVSYFGKTADIDIAIIPNPVTDVELKFADGSKTAKLIEGLNGYMATDWDENDNQVEYFSYYFPEYSVGDELYVTKNGGINKYVYKSNVLDGKNYREGFVNINSDSDVIFPDDLYEIDSNQSASAPWVRGGSGYYFELSYYGFEFRVPAEVIQNPVSAIDFSRDGFDADHPIELTEGLDAEINSDGGSNRFFEYYLNFKGGDKIKLTDPENKTSDYVAVPYSDGDEARYFENDEGKRIKPYSIEQSSDQSYENQWKPGDGTHTINLEYFARKTGVNVKIKENPVQNISFVRPGSDTVELREQGDGYWNGNIFRYEIDFRSGDELYMTYAGTDKAVKYVASEENGHVTFTAEGSVPEGAKKSVSVEGAEKSISADEFYFRHNSDYKLDVEEGEQATIMLMYNGMWTDVPVTIVDNPVEGIEFVWAGGGNRIELTEGVDGWNDHIEFEDGEVDTFTYMLPFASGDILKVKYKGADEPVSYVFNDKTNVFTAQGSLPEGAPGTIAGDDVERNSDQNYDIEWKVGEDHVFELTYLGNIFEVPVTIVKETVPECEHEYNTIAEVKATCTANGVKAHYECKKCHKLFVKEGDAYVGTTEESLVIPALGHKFGAWTKCDENQHQRVCENDSSHVEKADHNWDNGKVTKEASCEEQGVKTYTCSVCGETKTEAIPAAGHDETKIDAVEPTCTEPGHKEGKKCSVCDKILVAPKVIPALGHDYGEWSVTKEATCDTAGSKEKTCSVCGDKVTEEIPALGHDWGNPEWTWSEDHSSASAKRVCRNDATHVETVDAEITSAPDETGDNIVYTAKVIIGGKEYTDTVTVENETANNERIYGTARYDTAIEAAEKYKGSADSKFENVIVAYGRNFPDALAGGYLAKVKNAPILLVEPSQEDRIADYISKNISSGGKVYLLGGTGVVSPAFESKVKGKGIKTERLGGATRYETNMLILEAAGVTNQDILVCTGTGYADSLSASAVGKPILLVGDTLTDAQKSYIKGLSSDQFYLIGGTGAVKPAIETGLRNLGYSKIERLAGSTRYETSTAVAEKFFPKAKTVLLAYAQNFPDGLSGGPLAMKKNAPIILTASAKTEAAAKYVKTSGALRSITLGGPTLISDIAVKAIMGI